MAKKQDLKGRRGPDRLPQRLFSYLITHEYASRLSTSTKKPWEEPAGAFAEKLRRGAWEEIDKGAFVDFLEDVSVAIRSRYDKPSAAAREALNRIFDALSSSGPGAPDGWEGLKSDRLYRPGREALLEEWLLCARVKREAQRLLRADESFSTREYFKKCLGENWAGRLSVIERYTRDPRLSGARTEREMRKALGLTTRSEPKRRSPKPPRQFV